MDLFKYFVNCCSGTRNVDPYAQEFGDDDQQPQQTDQQILTELDAPIKKRQSGPKKNKLLQHSTFKVQKHSLLQNNIDGMDRNMDIEQGSGRDAKNIMSDKPMVHVINRQG